MKTTMGAHPLQYTLRSVDPNQLSVLEMMNFVDGGDSIEVSHPETWEEEWMVRVNTSMKKCQFYPCLAGMYDVGKHDDVAMT